MNTILLSIISLGGMALVFGLGLGFAGIMLAVKEYPQLNAIKEALPGANCGGCGYAGCEALANAIFTGKAKPNSCPVGGDDCTIKISEIMGIKAEIIEKQVAFVRCNGGNSNSNFRYDYEGLNNCKAAIQLAGGGCKSCPFGCVGGGSCLVACKFGAVKMVDGIACIDPEKCTACGMCVAACPKNIIKLIPYKSEVKVACCSNDPGKTVRANCSVGCIGCKICEKACNFDAIHVTDNLATIDYEKCTLCGECVKKCPTKVIKIKSIRHN